MLSKCLFLLFLLSGCQLTQDKSKFIRDGEPEEARWHPYTNLNQLPLSLWTEEQKASEALHRFLVAEYSSLHGDVVSSYQNHKLAHTLDANKVTALKNIQTLLRVGKVDEAKKQIDLALILYPTSKNIIELAVQVYLSMGKLDDAQKVMVKLLNQFPNDFSVLMQQVQLLLALERSNQALEMLYEISKKFPGKLQTWSVLARIHLDAKDYEAALKGFERSIELGDSSIKTLTLCSYLYLMKGDLKKAAFSFKKAVDRKELSEDFIARTMILKQFFDLQEIRNRFEQLVARVDPEDQKNLYLQIVFFSWDLKDYQRSLEILNKLLSFYPHSYQITYLLGLTKERIKEFEEAKQIYNRIGIHSKFYLPAQTKISKIYLIQNQWEKALEIVLKLIHNQYSTWDVYVQAANIYSIKKRYKQAVHVLEGGITRYPQKVQLLFLKGVYLERLGEIEECILTMQKVIQKDASHASAYNYLGYIYAERGENLNQAEDLILKALSIKPNDGYFLDSLGWVYFKKGDYSLALKFLHEALNQIPNESVVLEHIGDVYLVLEDKAKAKEYYFNAHKKAKEEQDQKRIKGKINELSN